MAGVDNRVTRERSECLARSEETTFFKTQLKYFRKVLKCLPDFFPSLICLIVVFILSIILQTETDFESLKNIYSKLVGLSNSTGEKLTVIETLLLKMGIDCGVDDLEMRNIKDNRNQLEEMIKHRLKEYDCVKNGMINWASTSLGGKVIKAKGAEATFDSASFLGIPCFKYPPDPAVVIDKSSKGNDCWTFKGEGKVLLKLAAPIYITHFTIEHFPRDMIPNKDLSSAPKQIVLKGYRHKNDASPHTFGAFEFRIDEIPYQTFSVQTRSHSQFEIVEFQFRTNHGNRDVTCVYRLQVHGRLTMDPAPLS